MAKTIQNLIKIISCDVITYKRRDIIAQSRDLMTSSCRWLPLEVIFITSVSSRQSTKSRNKKQQIDREIKTRLICYAHKVQPVLSYKMQTALWLVICISAVHGGISDTAHETTAWQRWKRSEKLFISWCKVFRWFFFQ